MLINNNITKVYLYLLNQRYIGNEGWGFPSKILFISIIILSFQSHQTRILSVGLGRAWNRDGLSWISYSYEKVFRNRSQRCLFRSQRCLFRPQVCLFRWQRCSYKLQILADFIVNFDLFSFIWHRALWAI